MTSQFRRTQQIEHDWQCGEVRGLGRSDAPLNIVDSFLAYVHVMSQGAVDNGWRLPQGDASSIVDGVFDAAEGTSDLETLDLAVQRLLDRETDELIEEARADHPCGSMDQITAAYHALRNVELAAYGDLRSRWRLGWSY